MAYSIDATGMIRECYKVIKGRLSFQALKANRSRRRRSTRTHNHSLPQKDILETGRECLLTVNGLQISQVIQKADIAFSFQLSRTQLSIDHFDNQSY